MSAIYNSFKRDVLNGNIDLDTDTIGVALVSNSPAYTPDIDAETVVDDVLDGGITASELSGTGYARKTLSVTVSQDNVDDEGVADATDLSWTGLDAGTIDGMLVFKDTGSDTTSNLVCYLTSADFPLTTNGGDVNLNFNAEGFINLG